MIFFFFCIQGAESPHENKKLIVQILQIAVVIEILSYHYYFSEMFYLYLFSEQSIADLYFLFENFQ